MSSYKHLSSPVSKPPTDVRHWLEQVASWIILRRTFLMRGSLALLVAIVVGASWWGYTRSQSAKAAKALADVKVLAADSPEFQSALENIANHYRSTPSGLLATFELGGIFAEKGDTERAKALYEDVIHRSRSGLLRNASRYHLVELLMDGEKWSEAVDVLREGNLDPENVLRNESLLLEGRCHEALGALDTAKNIYQRILDAKPQASLNIRSHVEERLKWLSANDSGS